MNANELADEVMKLDYLIGRTAYEIADTLRQQQAEIEALKYEKSSGVYDLAKTLTNEEYKPLTEADAPYQKVAPKEVADAIDKALGLKTLTNEEMLKQIRHAIVGKDCGVPVGHYLAKCKGWNFMAEMYCDGINWFYADHCIGDPDTPRLRPIKDGVELIYIEMNDWQPFRFPPLKEEKEVPLNQIDWWSKDVIDDME
jgi:hypothetical protein